MNRLKKTALLVFTLLFVLFFYACDLYTYVTPSTEVSYDNPTWAPPYSQGVRYYYLPDIETYYDLSTGEFVYLNDGQWSYSQGLPSIYSGYDLGNCFTVALDYNIYQPWMHHHYYVSHYPRYYYRDYYDHSNIPNVRGFNENSRSAVYWSENDRSRARNWDSENLKTNHQFTYSKPDRQQQNNTQIRNNQNPDMNNGLRQQPTNANNSFNKPDRGSDNPGNQQSNRGSDNPNIQQPDRGINNPTPPPSGNGNGNRRDGNTKTSIVTPPRISGFETGARQQNAVSPVRPAQNTNYYGRTIGQPVKVQKQMRQRTLPNPPANTNTRNNSDSRNQNDSNRR
jgi:hypothetical protein